MNYSQEFKDNIALWCSELRSGKWKQTTCRLQNEQGHCCLGVACEIFIPKEKQLRYEEYLDGGGTAYQYKAPEWLRRIDSTFRKVSGCTLMTLNDAGFTFDEIADCLEVVFIHEVLA